MKAKEVVDKMTIVEKVNLTTGTGWGSGPCIGNTGSVPRLGIPNLCLQDGPNGVRFTDFVTHFPSGLASGSTFNRGLIYLRGKALGREHKKKGVHIMLGPTIGPIGLKAAGGRNWEGFGADPYLQGIGGAATVEGIQEEGVIATVRHLIGNEQEHFRQVGEWNVSDWFRLEKSISSNIGDKEMHEIYLWPFADIVRSGAGSVMCSYNQVNNTYACENSYLLNYLLKEELGFQGFIMSDWGSQHTGVYSALAGLDMSMPGTIFNEWLGGKSYWGLQLTKAVYNQTLPQQRLNDMTIRILAPFFFCNKGIPKENDIPNFSSWTYNSYGQQYPLQNYGPTIQQNWHKEARSKFSDQVALNIAREAVVLLKNRDSNLPISRIKGIKKILISGVAAGADPKGFNCKDQQCVNGVLTTGWGSATVNNPYIITPYEAISQKAKDQGMLVEFSTDSWKFDNVEELAANSDMSIVIVNSNAGEGYIQVDNNYGDRKNFSLWHNGDELISRISQRCRKTVVVVNGVGPVNMEKWIEKESVVAVIFAAPLGQFVGQAIADVLFGDVNPSGKLPFTIARDDQHYVPLIDTLNGSSSPQDNFERGIYLDYRFFEKFQIEPRFEFGYGLSYTDFQFSDLRITEIDTPLKKLAQPNNYLPAIKLDEKNVVDPKVALFPIGAIDPVPGVVYPYLQDRNLSSPNNKGDFDYPLGYKPDTVPRPPSPGGCAGGNPALWNVLYEIKASITNAGRYSGGIAVQMYIEFPETPLSQSAKVLRGFDKVFLDPGEGTEVKFKILQRDLSTWDVKQQEWVIQNGTYKVYISTSSRENKLYGLIQICC